MWPCISEVGTRYALVKGEGIILLYQPLPLYVIMRSHRTEVQFCISSSRGWYIHLAARSAYHNVVQFLFPSHVSVGPLVYIKATG